MIDFGTQIRRFFTCRNVWASSSQIRINRSMWDIPLGQAQKFPAADQFQPWVGRSIGPSPCVAEMQQSTVTDSYAAACAIQPSRALDTRNPNGGWTQMRYGDEPKCGRLLTWNSWEASLEVCHLYMEQTALYGDVASELAHLRRGKSEVCILRVSKFSGRFRLELWLCTWPKLSSSLTRETRPPPDAGTILRRWNSASTTNLFYLLSEMRIVLFQLEKAQRHKM